MSDSEGWIGVDLDGTLAHYDGWVGPVEIGEPIGPMVERVKRWLSEGYTVKIVTARVTTGSELANTLIRGSIGDWCREHLGAVLEVTCSKDLNMLELWDDRAVQVIANTGEPVGRSTRGARLMTDEWLDVSVFGSRYEQEYNVGTGVSRHRLRWKMLRDELGSEPERVGPWRDGPSPDFTPEQEKGPD